MKEFLNLLIQNKIKRYKDDYSEMLGDYNREKETTKGYNGRQLLELLQNCDDEGADRVLIKLDKANRTITIANNGKPFSEKGYRSLFIANLSAKTSKSLYIGNKGLGFRSIINWAQSVEIQSNNLTLKYSEENRIKIFNELFTKDEQAEIRTDGNFLDDTIPVPFLCIPELSDIESNAYVTCIIIEYQQEHYKSILDQVNQITPEILLFLNNLLEIRFEGFEGKSDILCTKRNFKSGAQTLVPSQQVTFERFKWNVFSREDELPANLQDSDRKEKEHFQIKIAIEENFGKSARELFSFFPTKIILDQPYILHATFDLDSTRNQINDSEKNKYILSEIVRFTTEVAKSYKSKRASYRPLQILYHKKRADSLLHLRYYEFIDAAINTETIFPCIDNEYRRLNDVVYIDDEFARIVTQIGATSVINNHILAVNENYDLLKDAIDQVDNELDNPISVLNQICSLPLAIKHRAIFIKQVINNFQFLITNFENQLNLLVNDDGKVIYGEEYIYTPASYNNILIIPTYAKIQFIKKELFNELLRTLNHDSKEFPNKGRFVYDKLKGFCNIHSYEPVTLAEKIVREAKSIVDSKPLLALRIIKEMNACLYHNFKEIDEDTRNTKLRITVPGISLSGKIIDTKDLVLSESYPAGSITAAIFNGVYNDDNYIAPALELGIEVLNEEALVEQYLLWINVNRFAVYDDYVGGSFGYEDYVDFLKKSNKINTNNRFILELKLIKDFKSIIERLSIENLVLWINFDNNLSNQLNNTTNTDKVKYSYNVIQNKPSYLKYLIYRFFVIDFTGFITDERYRWANEKELNYGSELFSLHNISKANIVQILLLLGAKDDIVHLPLERIASILNKIPTKFKDGKGAQSYYKRILAHYREHDQILNIPVELFADNGTKLDVYKQSDVFFSDRVRLPNKLREKFPVFYFPPRAGGADAIDFFGINDLKDIDVKVISFVTNDELTHRLKSYIDELKPLILAKRLDDTVEEGEKKKQAQICKNIEIICCTDIEFQVKGENYEVLNFEFLLRNNHTYLLKVGLNDKLESLLNSFLFGESFDDLLSLSFDISSEKNEFKHFLRNTYNNNYLSISKHYGLDAIQEAKELLGLADYKNAFWDAVFRSKFLTVPEDLNDLSIEKVLIDSFNIVFDPTSIDYERLNEQSEISKIESLFNSINLQLADFILVYPDLTLKDIHSKSIVNAILSKKNEIKDSIWYSLKDADVENQAYFLDKLNKYEYCSEFAEAKAGELEQQFQINIEEILNEYITIVYGTLEMQKNVNLDSIRDNNYKEFNKDELVIINQSKRFRSLIYFENAIPLIKVELIQSIANEEPSSIVSVASSTLGIIDSKYLKRKKLGSTSSRKKTGVYIPGQTNSNGNKEKGNLSEELVYNFLKSNSDYSDVYWASLDDEGFHYDIRYTDLNNVVKFVEVKTFDTGRFFLTKDEHDFGIANEADYEIWLVHCKEHIIPIKDFFTNEKYQILPNEYLITLEIEIP